MKGSQNVALLRKQRVSLRNSATFMGWAPGWSLAIRVLLCNPHPSTRLPPWSCSLFPGLIHTWPRNGFTGLNHSTFSEQAFSAFIAMVSPLLQPSELQGLFRLTSRFSFPLSYQAGCLSIRDCSQEQAVHALCDGSLPLSTSFLRRQQTSFRGAGGR